MSDSRWMVGAAAAVGAAGIAWYGGALGAGAAAAAVLGLTWWSGRSQRVLALDAQVQALGQAAAKADAAASLALVAAEFRQQFEAARDELGRLRAIIDQAIATLVPGFSRIHALTAQQGALAIAIVRGAVREEGSSEHHSMAEVAQEITDKIRIAARAKLRIARMHTTGANPVMRDAGHALPAAGGVMARRLVPGTWLFSTEKLIPIGASTGGTEAIREVLMGMAPDSPGILITQHMPAGFTKSFAERLNKCCDIAVKEAEDGERVLPGHAYIAPGSHHLLLRKSGANYLTVLSDAPPVNRHRPSVEVLFKSGAEVAGPNVVGVMLTGMGKDGA